MNSVGLSRELKNKLFCGVDEVVMAKILILNGQITKNLFAKKDSSPSKLFQGVCELVSSIQGVLVL